MGSFLNKILIPLMDSKTRNKIRFVSGEAEKREVIDEVIGLEHMLAACGGSSSFTFNLISYLQEDEAYFIPDVT